MFIFLYQNNIKCLFLIMNENLNYSSNNNTLITNETREDEK